MSCPVCRESTPELEKLAACPACGRELKAGAPGGAPAAQGQKTCPNCGKVFAADFALSNCPACKVPLETGQPPHKPAKSAKQEYTADSPIWESGKDKCNFLYRAGATFWQFLRHPLKTFAAPRSTDYFPSFMFFLTCSFTNILLAKIFLLVLSLIFPETIQALSAKGLIGFDLAEARDFLALLGAMVFGTLKFMVTAGVMAASLHLFLLILHRKRKGFTVSFQLVCYSQGVSSLMSMVVTILTAGISMAGPAAATICLWAGGTAELLIKLFSLFLIFAGLLAGHKLGRIKAGLVIILFVAFWVGVGLWLAGR